MTIYNEETESGIPPKPTALPVLAEGIPAELKLLDRWITWSFVWKNDRQKWDKPPRLPDASGPASSTDSATWGTFRQVIETYNAGNCDGIGFVFNGDGIVGIDLDNKNQSTNTDAQNQEAGAKFLRIADRLNSYTEQSPSGTGLHILARGELPKGRRHTGAYEVYETGRYFTVTGHSAFRLVTSLAPNQDGIDWFHATYIAVPKKERAVEQTVISKLVDTPKLPMEILLPEEIGGVPSVSIVTPIKERQPKRSHESNLIGTPSLSDEEILDLIGREKDGDKWQQVIAGGTTGYNSASEAVSALIWKFAFYTKDPVQIDSLFRVSAHYRRSWIEKWDRLGPDEITTALANVTEQYQPHHGSKIDQTLYPYAVEDGRVCLLVTKKSKDGDTETVKLPLSNFTFHIDKSVNRHDGEGEPQKVYTIQGKLNTGEKLPTVQVRTDDYTSMQWVRNKWDRAIIEVRTQATNHMQVFGIKNSFDLTSHEVFLHLGWRQDNKVFLTASNAGVDVQNDPNLRMLKNYSLPEVAEDPVSAMRASLSLLKLFPAHVIYPLYCAMFRAPLASQIAVDTSIWVIGRSGVFKSALVALLLSHFGKFDYRTLPASFLSTGTILEILAFTAKDLPLVIDEYKIEGTNKRDYEAKAMRLIRGQGNGQGRARANRNLEQRQTYYPRGIIIATGENIPPTGDSDSLKARTLIIRMIKGEIALPDILKLNKEIAPILPHAMKGYIDFIQSQVITTFTPVLLNLREQQILKVGELDGHHRVATSTADLYLGMVSALMYAVSNGAVTKQEAWIMAETCWETLMDLAKKQNLMLGEDRVSRSYLTVLNTLLSQGKAVLAPTAEAESPGPRNGFNVLGWFDSEYLYLDLNEPYRMVQQYFRDTGQVLTASDSDLKYEFKESGLSVCDTDRQNRLDKTITIGQKKRRLLHLKIVEVEKLIEVDRLADTLAEGWKHYQDANKSPRLTPRLRNDNL